MNTRTLAAAANSRPPGPPCHFFGIPEMRAMTQDYLGFVTALQRQYGDTVYMHLGPLHDYSLFHPEQMRELLVGAHADLIRWERGTEVFAAVHGQSVLVVEGETWARKRRLLQPGFAPKRVAGFARAMVDAGEQALSAWPDGAEARTGFELDFEQAMTGLTMDVILRTLFSSAANDEARLAEDAVRVLSQEAMREFYWPASAPLWAPWKSAKRRALGALDGLIRGHIAARKRALARGETGTDDLLAMLLQLRQEDGSALDDEALRDECMTIFLAGHETSAAALTWWGWCMADNPDCAEQAAAEVLQHLHGRRPEFGDVAALPYLGQTLKEAMRLYPPAAALLTRRTLRPIELSGLHIPQGATLRLTPILTQHDARWFPEPEAFKPERFAADAPETPRGAYLPFGAGPRVCLGSHFALTEITLLAALLLQRYRLLPVPGRPAPLPVINISLRPDRPLHLILQARAVH